MTALSVLAARSCRARRPLLQLRLARLGLGRAASTDANVDDKLDFPAIDRKWRERWKTSGHAQLPNAVNKKYILPMFPYPSGALHMGHVRVYTISDVLARFWLLCGHDTIHPMGWDAFGLPAENAAIERGIDPAEWTASNIQKMKEQLEMMNGRWDWDREIMTCDPAYYKHTQSLFLSLHAKRLAYQDEAEVNWDPVDGTVLANEQVDSKGYSWRSGAKVERRRMKQWFLRITAFQEALLEDIDKILAKDGRWPDRVLAMQKHWIGKSEGQQLQFRMQTIDGQDLPPAEIFTTRADTLFGVQYVALSLEHPIVKEMAQGFPELQKFLEEAPSYSPDSKAGFLLPGVHAINPASILDNPSSHVQKPLPVFVAPYVLSGYGSGAVMGVPGHDGRDLAFWKENKGNAPILKVVEHENPGKKTIGQERQNKIVNRKIKHFQNKGRLTDACGPVSGLTSDEAIPVIVKLLSASGQKVETKHNWRLRDWLISRQRYWGTPIPIVHCESCGPVRVKKSDLPVELPKFVGSERGKGGNPLADEKMSDWVNTECPRCNKPAKRETDTMDTFMDSSWYFFRFLNPHDEVQAFQREWANKFLPVDLYIGGIEHAILHLLYARFISKFLHRNKRWEGGGEYEGEPFKRLITQGMVHGKTLKDPTTGRFLKPDEVYHNKGDVPRVVGTNEAALETFEKMSKSKYNGVDPLETISVWGADATRAHILFQAPVTEVLKWDDEKIVGIQRWFKRVWKVTKAAANLPPMLPPMLPQNLKESATTSTKADEICLNTQQTIKKVTTSFESTLSLNTVISDLIKFTNSLHEQNPSAFQSTIDDSGKHILRDAEGVDLMKTDFCQRYYQAVQSLLIMLAPIAPAFAEECYEQLVNSPPYRVFNKHGQRGTFPRTIFAESFPAYSDELIAALFRPDIPVGVAIEGRMRMQTHVPAPDMALLSFKTTPQVEALKAYLIEEVLKTREGRRLFGPGSLYDIADPSVVQTVQLHSSGLKGQFLNIKRWHNKCDRENWLKSQVGETRKKESRKSKG